MRGARWSAKPRAALRTATSGLYGLVRFPRFEGMGPAETRAFGQGDERLERKTNTNGTEMDEPATPKAMNDTVQKTAKVPPRKGGQTRRYLGSGVRFTRHLLEMVVAMLTHVAMIGGMVAMMVYRWDRYAHGGRDSRA
jgi:hypothetical protein